MSYSISQTFNSGLTKERREEILKLAAAKKLKIPVTEIDPCIQKMETTIGEGTVYFSAPKPKPTKKKKETSPEE